MPRQILVHDPLYHGKPPIPLVTRSQAMRRMYEQLGMSVGDIARQYGITYQLAYKQINPPRLPASDPHSTAPKPLTKERLDRLPRGQLERIATAKSKDPAILQRAQAAADALDKRFPNWINELKPVGR